MFRSHRRSRTNRSGVILLVVVALLALFATIGLAFVLYAESEASASRNIRENEFLGHAELEPELLLSYFLNQLIYDAPADSIYSQGAGSALRGHSLQATLFGVNATVANPNAWVHDRLVGTNNKPYSGTGRLHRPGVMGQDDYHLVNYTWFRDDGFIRDPERMGTRTSPAEPYAANGWVGGHNPPYTYPDVNNMFLAAARADGTILLQSYHRPGPPGIGFGSLDPNNPNWYGGDQSMKYKVLRPRPADMGPGFPAPEDAGGDVKNWPWGPGYRDPQTGQYHVNDSIWLDLGFPVRTLPDGRKFKPLFAPLIVDLDSRINLNACGNVRGPNNTHLSNQGWGRWEVNLSRVLNRDNPADPQEWKNLFLPQGPYGSELGRYGGNGAPYNGNSSASFSFSSSQNLRPHYYSPVDYDGNNSFHYVSRDPNSPQQGPPLANEVQNHPALYKYWSPTGDDRKFSRNSDMEALLRYEDTGSPALTSRLFWRLPMNLRDHRVRGMVTLMSHDFDVPGMTAALAGPDPRYQLAPPPQNGPDNLYPRSAQAMEFPAQLPLPQDSWEFDSTGQANLWRTSSRGLWRLDVGFHMPVATDPVATNGSQRTNYYLPADDQNVPPTPTHQAVESAHSSRQLFASDIFLRLRTVTGASNQPAGPEQLDALRWLAQLAVNIVDYLDEDDNITPFFWAGNCQMPGAQAHNKSHWVFGVEQPRVILTGGYANYMMPLQQNQAKKVKVWAKLFDPFQPQDGSVRLTSTFTYVDPDDPLGMGMPKQYHDGYRIVMCKPNTVDHVKKRANGPGSHEKIDPMDMDPGLAYKRPEMNMNMMEVQVLAKASNFSPNNISPQGTYTIGAEQQCPVQGAMVTCATAEMKYETMDDVQPLTLLLQRLACPWAPHEDDPGRPYFNPYITIDYLTDIPVNQDNQQNAAWTERPQQPPYEPHHVTHLDRPPASVMELLHVAACKPTDYLRKKLLHPDYEHHAPWFDQTARLYRVFEFLGTQGRGAGDTPAAIQTIGPLRPNGRVVTGNLRPGTDGGRIGVIDPGVRVLVGNEYVRVTRIARVPEPNGAPGSYFDATLTPANIGYRDPGQRPWVHILSMGNRVPGRVNLNTVWDPEIFQAVCDIPGFDSQIAANVLRSRSAEVGPGIFYPTGNDRPFRGMAPAVSQGDMVYQNGAGIEDTFLRSAPGGGGRLFELPPPPQQPGPNDIGNSRYEQYKLMTKVFDRFTCRSHVFAVFITVGFFEVVPGGENYQPVKLGAEIGRSENRHVRHRMFALVDRSLLYTNGTDSNSVGASMADQVLGASPQAESPRVRDQNMLENLIVGQRYPVDRLVPPRMGDPNGQPEWQHIEDVVLTSVDYEGGTVTAAFRFPEPDNGLEWRLRIPNRWHWDPHARNYDEHYDWDAHNNGRPGTYARSFNPRSDGNVRFFSIID